ncbi:MAG: hypothetical protein HY770_05740 [Chitinivibrionia bacterium]|nr:hypothetical protein [Chitinivibrionia bacterium]
MRRISVTAAIVAFIVTAAAGANAGRVDSSLLRSMLIPGSGQAHQGHYVRAALFAAGGVIGGTGIFITQLHYNRAVERYDREKGIYLEFARKVESGELVQYEEMQSTYTAMQDAWDSSENRLAWRNAFLGLFITSYALNIVDVLWNPGEKTEPVSMEFEGSGVRLVKTINF